MSKITRQPASLLFIALMAFAITSCKKSDVAEPVKETAPVETLRQFLMTTTGQQNVVYVPAKQQFVIAGDGIISLEQGTAHFQKFSAKELPTTTSGTQQRQYAYTIVPAKAQGIKIYVDATVPAVWLPAIDQAIANWNATGSAVYLYRVYASTTTTTSGGGKKKTTTTSTVLPAADVTMTTNYETSNTIAFAYYPDAYGNPGKSVTINTYYNTLDNAYKIFTITHELGHNLGLTHTDGTYGSIIAGTPDTDPSSVMNSVCLPWSNFTAYDFLAIRTVYPK